MSLEILPLAITMMAGPQIMSAIVFVTSEGAVRKSFAFVAGVLLATAMWQRKAPGTRDDRGGVHSHMPTTGA